MSPPYDSIINQTYSLAFWKRMQVPGSATEYHQEVLKHLLCIQYCCVDQLLIDMCGYSHKTDMAMDKPCFYFSFPV